MNSKLESNKQAAIAFLRMALVDKNPEEAIRLYVGDYYTQHNPAVPNESEIISTHSYLRCEPTGGRK